MSSIPLITLLQKDEGDVWGREWTEDVVPLGGAGIPCGGIGGWGWAGPPHWPQPDLPPLLDACPRASLQAEEREREREPQQGGQVGRKKGKKEEKSTPVTLFLRKGKKLLMGPTPL